MPFIKQEYFEDYTLKVIFDEISYVDKYEVYLEATAIAIGIDKRQDVNESTYKEIISFWVTWTRINTTKNGCMILKMVQRTCDLYRSHGEHQVTDGQDKTRSRDAITSIMSGTWSLFDDHIGHDFLLDSTTGMTTITERKKNSPISNISTRSQRWSLIKLSTSLLLVRASSLYSCAMSLVPLAETAFSIYMMKEKV